MEEKDRSRARRTEGGLTDVEKKRQAQEKSHPRLQKIQRRTVTDLFGGCLSCFSNFDIEGQVLASERMVGINGNSFVGDGSDSLERQTF